MMRAVASVVLLALAAAPALAGPYPTNVCVSAKQQAAGRYCKQGLSAWANFATKGNAGKRDAALGAAAAALAAAWSAAEAKAAAKGVDCVETTLSASAAQSLVDSAIAAVVDQVDAGLVPGNRHDAQCARQILRAAAGDCQKLLQADGLFVEKLDHDPTRAKRNQKQAAARSAFAKRFAKATAGGCHTTATANGLQGILDGVDAGIVEETVVSPNVDDTQFTEISPTGTTVYQGKQLAPQCIYGQPYHFFVKRGSVNKLVMYYQGGGACWDALTCGIPTCDSGVDSSDDPDAVHTGFADLSNPNNPFRDWNIVFVAYCSCDIHFGDAEKDYTSTLHIQHRGFDNAKIAEKWAREHFVDPDVVFVTGSSAGAYGAWFHAPLLHPVWPASQFHVLADAGNGVITQNFLETYFPNWNFIANIPKTIPGVLEALQNGSGIPGYTEAVAKFFPHTTWAHYATAYDGGTGGQTGFYAIMLNNNNPLAALSWWTASCQWNQVMEQQVQQTAAALTTTNNYRYYVGTGSRHTMWGSDKVYTDTSGGVPTIVDWINATLASTPPAGNSPAWTDVQCTDCGVLLPGDPQPPTLPTPPFEQVGPNVVIDCPSSAGGAFVE
jgi:hypothetical protein